MSLNDQNTNESFIVNSVPSSWKKGKVGSLVKNIALTGKKIKQKEYSVAGTFPVVDQGVDLIGGYTDDEKLCVDCKLPVIVFGDHTKIIKYISFPFVAGADGIKVLEPKDEYISPKLLFYYLQALPIPDKGYSRHYQFLKNSELPVPPIPEQKRIVAKIEELFTRLDAGVENLKKTRQLLKNYRQAVLRDAFTGKLTGRINHQDTKASRKLPDGWEWKALGDLIAEGPQNGFYTHKSNYGTGIPILRIDDYQIGSHRSLDELQKVNVSADILKSYKLEENDLVINRVNSPSHLGKSLVISSAMSGAIFESNMMKMKLSKNILPKYVNWFLSSTVGRGFLTQNAKWAVNQASINQQDVKATRIPLAPLNIQSLIVLEIERHFSIADAVEKEIEEALNKSDSLRQSILKSAFEGKLVTTEHTEHTKSMKYPEFSSERLAKVAEGNKENYDRFR